MKNMEYYLLAQMEDKIQEHLSECKKYKNDEPEYHRHFWCAVGIGEAKAVVRYIYLNKKFDSKKCRHLLKYVDDENFIRCQFCDQIVD